MKRKEHLLIKVILILILISVSVSGCGSSREVQDNEESRLAIYSEKEIDKPENINSILSVRSNNEDEISIIGGINQICATSIFISNDEGEKWQKQVDLKEMLDLNEQSYCNAIFLKDDIVFCEVVREFNDDPDNLFKYEKQYYSVSIVGVVTEVKIKLPEVNSEQGIAEGGEYDAKSAINGISYCDSISENKMIIMDYNENIYLLNVDSGRLDVKYEMNNQNEKVIGFSYIEETLIVFGYDGIYFFDIETGEQIPQERLKSELLSAMNEGDKIAARNGVMFVNNENSLYVLNNAGLFEYDRVVEKLSLLTDSNNTVIMEQGLYAKALAVSNEDKFYVVAQSMETMQDVIYCYEKTNEVYTEELTVWSLKENNDVYNIISAFKKENSNVNIKVEIGMSGEDGIIASDAIKTLNTKILAGDSPDILILDHLAIDSYIDKELLMDISDVLEAVNVDDEVLFSNIAKAYESQGGFYAVPTRFSTTYIEADKGIVNSSMNLNRLVEEVKHFKSNNPAVKLFTNDFNYLATFLYYGNSSGFIKNNVVDKQFLEDFFVNIETIHSLDYEDKGTKLSNSKNIFLMSTNYYDVAAGEFEIAFDTISAAGYQFAGMEALKYVDDTIDYSVAFSDLGMQYQPSIIAGISARTDKGQLCKEFIECMLSEEVQNIDTGSGMPVNKTAFYNSLELAEEFEIDLGDLTLYLKQMKDDDKRELINHMESLDTVVDGNAIILEIVFEQLNYYLAKEISLNTAVEDAARKIELWLSE